MRGPSIAQRSAARQDVTMYVPPSLQGDYDKQLARRQSASLPRGGSHSYTFAGVEFPTPVHSEAPSESPPCSRATCAIFCFARSITTQRLRQQHSRRCMLAWPAADSATLCVPGAVTLGSPDSSVPRRIHGSVRPKLRFRVSHCAVGIRSMPGFKKS